MVKIMTFMLFCFITFTTSNAQVVLNDFEDASIYFDGLFESPSSLDQYGNIVLDLGSASAGRLKFRISDVNISMEESPEEPGCADICPPRIIISFKCIKSECISDPAFEEMGSYPSSAISIFNIKRGKKAFEYLKALKQFIDKN